MPRLLVQPPAPASPNLILDRFTGDRTVRPVEALLEVRLKLRGQLRNQILSLIRSQAATEHAGREQRGPLRTLAIQLSPAGDNGNHAVVGRLGARPGAKQGAGTPRRLPFRARRCRRMERSGRLVRRLDFELSGNDRAQRIQGQDFP